MPTRLRTGGGASFRAALLLIGLFALTLGGLQLAAGAAPESPTPFWIPVAFTLVYGIWAAAGIIAWWRRPQSGTGGLLLVGAVAMFFAGAGNLGLPVLTGLSTVFATTVLAVTLHLLHAFPSGRLQGRLSKLTVAVGYAVTLVLQMPLYLLPPEQTTLHTVASWVQSVVGFAVMLLTAVILLGRLRSADPSNRGVLLPVYATGILAVIMIPLSANFMHLLPVDPEATGVVQLIVLAAIPIAFLLGVLFGRFTQTAEADALSAWLGSPGAAQTAAGQVLASSLGDDSLRLAYWSDERRVFLDEDGVEVDVRAQVPPRRWEEVRVESRLVGAISYDERMIADPETGRRAGGVCALAADRERLTAALMASHEELLLSRLRIVEAADLERTRIARDLHDGLQVQLVLLALEAQQIAAAAEADGPDAGSGSGSAPSASAPTAAATTAPTTAAAATALRHRLDDAAADLRRLVHAVLPPALVERGLTVAAEDLVDRLDIPATLTSDIGDLPLAPVTAQSAYLIVAEALTNTVKHSGASAVGVELTRRDGTLQLRVRDDGCGGATVRGSTGLKGLADRVDALGGSFELVSPRGAGTELRVELPCGL